MTNCQVVSLWLVNRKTKQYFTRWLIWHWWCTVPSRTHTFGGIPQRTSFDQAGLYYHHFQNSHISLFNNIITVSSCLSHSKYHLDQYADHYADWPNDTQWLIVFCLSSPLPWAFTSQSMQFTVFHHVSRCCWSWLSPVCIAVLLLLTVMEWWCRSPSYRSRNLVRSIHTLALAGPIARQPSLD